jgi:aryl-alcohol dehydrogenase-like predicted oxidoreductase
VSTSTAAPPETFELGGTTTIRRLGFGTMRLTGPGVWGPPRDHDQSIRVLRHAVERGVTFLDTADSYGPFVAEQLIHEALHPYPAELVIATKAGLTRGGPGDWRPLGRPEYLRQQCELSLRHLALERIELYQLHRVDPKVPLATRSFVTPPVMSPRLHVRRPCETGRRCAPSLAIPFPGSTG